ncbi:MAG: diguanylate cyclase [Nitrospirae bacterium]|nr:diguanylate cyclase [Nitrospirota bacterium]
MKNVQSGKVLVVDDDPDVLQTVVTRLKGSGWMVGEARDGRSALEQIRNGKFDVIVLDVMLPDVDGYTVLRQILATPDHPRVIFLSALSSTENRLKGLGSGAVDYVSKPFDPRELAARVMAAAREKAELDEVRRASEMDPLTGLWNRGAFGRTLTLEVARSRRYRRPLALAYVDADGMKQINDTFGHVTGDRYIQAVAKAVKATCRRADFPSRIGGDEFAVILVETRRPGADQYAQRFRWMIGRDRSVRSPEGQWIPVSASIGTAVFWVDAYDQESLCRAADAAMYRVKKAA